MTLLPGHVDLDRVDDGEPETLAQVLAAIHDLRPAVRPRTYQSWAWSAKYVVPDWADDRAAWERAFAVLEQDPPPYDGTFLHRDFQPRNVLWTGPDLTGIVDWVETSWGPAWLDVAHCRTNLALQHGVEVADRFGAAYGALTGRVPAPYFDVMDVVGLLPPPGRRAFITDPGEQDAGGAAGAGVLASLWTVVEGGAWGCSADGLMPSARQSPRYPSRSRPGWSRVAAVAWQKCRRTAHASTPRTRATSSKSPRHSAASAAASSESHASTVG